MVLVVLVVGSMKNRANKLGSYPPTTKVVNKGKAQEKLEKLEQN